MKRNTRRPIKTQPITPLDSPLVLFAWLPSGGYPRCPFVLLGLLWPSRPSNRNKGMTTRAPAAQGQSSPTHDWAGRGRRLICSNRPPSSIDARHQDIETEIRASVSIGRASIVFSSRPASKGKNLSVARAQCNKEKVSPGQLLDSFFRSLTLTAQSFPSLS